jgi:hypothetical protein
MPIARKSGVLPLRGVGDLTIGREARRERVRKGSVDLLVIRPRDACHPARLMQCQTGKLLDLMRMNEFYAQQAHQ